MTLRQVETSAPSAPAVGDPYLRLAKQAGVPITPGADELVLALLEGTTPGTRKIVLQAGASGPVITLVDEIAASGADTAVMAIAKILASAIPDSAISTVKIADGAVTIAKLSFDPATQAELDAELDGTTGHSHSGAAGEGPKIADGSLSSGVTQTGEASKIVKTDAAGRVRLGAGPSANLDAASKQYVDTVLTMTMKRGSGAGDYTTNSNGTYVDVDGTNLAYTVTVPTGSKVLINVASSLFLSAAGTWKLAITDGTTVLAEAEGREGLKGGGLTYIFTGDGAQHTFKLRWQVTAAITATMDNATATHSPSMTFLMGPAN